MSAHGYTSFANDDAADLLRELIQSDDVSLIFDAFNVDFSYLEAPEGAEIVAAADMVLAMSGCYRKNLPIQAAKWAQQNSKEYSQELRERAKEALVSVLSDKSELKELWEDSNCFDEWYQEVIEIKGNLESL